MLSRLQSGLRRVVTLQEPLVWVCLFMVSAGVFIFAKLTSEMMEGETHGFDNTILLILRQTGNPDVPIGPAWLTKAFGDITSLGGITVLSLITLFVVIYLMLRRSHRAAFFVLGSILGGCLLSSALKLGVARPRPDLVPHLVEVYDFSFPSGHAMVSAVTYLTLGALLSRFEERGALRIYYLGAALLLTMLIGTSRVYLGVHYPTDVLGGWCAGIAWASLCWLVARRFLPRRAMRSPEQEI